MALHRPPVRIRRLTAGGTVLILAGLLVARFVVPSPMETRLARLRARGLPASVADLESSIPEAPAGPRTALLDAAADLSRAFTGDNSEDLDVLTTKPARDWTPADRDLAAATEPMLAGPTANLHSRLADGPLPLGWDSDPHTGRQRYSIFELIVAQRALALQFRAALAAGDLGNAFQHSTDQLRLCRSLHPTSLVTLIGRMALASIALPCLGEIAGAAPDDPTRLLALRQETFGLLTPEQETTAWICERLTLLEAWSTAPQSLFEGPIASGRPPRAVGDVLYRFTGLDRRDRITFFDYLEGVISAAGRTGAERAEAIARIGPPPQPRTFNGLVRPILAVVMPRPHGLLAEADSIRFRTLAARIALTAAMRKNRLGRWPDSLEDLDPDPGDTGLPADPATGLPLRWEATVNGFRILGTTATGEDPDEGRIFDIPVPPHPVPLP